ncbi:hypothetical protein D3C72_1871240 [compost metagenome]
MVGSITVFCGVSTAGVVGPNAAIELGQNTRSSPVCRASSSTLSRLVMFRFQAHCGAFSPVADSAAASR